MQRPRNRQNRQQTAESGGKGRGGSRGRGRERSRSDISASHIPTVRQVVSGAHVSIVLKIDQATGRQVQGTVAEVLTSGDHPRGIKVRLVDGRVGRVQRMVTQAEAGSEGLTNLGRNGESSVSVAALSARSSIRYHDAREEEHGNVPHGFSLGDFFPPDSLEEEEEEANSCSRDIEGSDDVLSFKSATQRCPVCYQFEGDELAVAHHVNSHFE